MEISSTTRILLFIFFIAISIILFSHPSLSQEVEDEHEFSYQRGGEKGPESWGELKPEWKLCGDGKMQSPIDLLDKTVQVVSHLGRLKRSYKPSPAILKNRGHDMMLKWEDGAGAIEINGTEYMLLQAHWHLPSEHTINGKRFSAELHMVHKSNEGRTAVIGILYKIGRQDSFLSSVMEYMRKITSQHEEIEVGDIDPKDFKFGSRKYYRYVGSLTTPPCSQNVVWTIVKKVRTLTREQVRLLRVAVHDEAGSNARPVQPQNNRVVHLYKPNN